MGTLTATLTTRNSALRDLSRALKSARQFAQGKDATERLAKLELFVRGQLLVRRRPDRDHTDFWHRAALRFPREANFLRKKIDAALNAGRTRDAEAAIEILLHSGFACASDSKFVVGLVNIYRRDGDTGAIRKILRLFMKSLRGRPDYRIAAVRLSRLLFVHFPGRKGFGQEPGTFEKHFRRMLDKAAIPPNPKLLLQRAMAVEKSLVGKDRLTWLDTDISREQCLAFIALVHAKLATREPFSFIRVGDGESNCLRYEPHLSGFEKMDAIKREQTWWGKSVDSGKRAKMAAQVSEAIWSADCIGVPTISRFLRDIRLAENHALDDGRAGRGLRSILYALENLERYGVAGPHLPIFTSCHLHQHLHRWNLYPALFDGVREVIVISCHPRLGEILHKRFGVSIAGNILLPPEHVSIPRMRHRSVERRRLPEIIDEVIEKIGELPRNRLVLVGAGYLGKRLINLARDRGGVALDVGSILDYWVGASTRSYLNLSSV